MKTYKFKDSGTSNLTTNDQFINIVHIVERLVPYYFDY